MRTLLRAMAIVGLLALTIVFNKSAQAAGPAVKIVLDPSAAAITADQTQTFKVMSVAADGTTVDVTSQATLSTDDPLGKVSAVVYTPGKTGVWTVQAVYQSFTTSAAVTVAPGAVKEIVVNPNSDPEQTYLGTNVKYAAAVYDGHSNIISGQTLVWSVVGDIGSIDATGTFKPAQVGTGKVQAAVGDVIGQVSVVVNAALVTNTTTTNTAVTNTAANANANQNTNAAANTNITATNNTNATVSTETAATDACTTMKPWVWTLLLLIFLLAVAVLYALVPVTKIWPVVAAIVAAGALAFIQRQYACGTQVWWAWVIVLGTIVLSAVALQMRPKNTPTV